MPNNATMYMAHDTEKFYNITLLSSQPLVLVYVPTYLHTYLHTRTHARMHARTHTSTYTHHRTILEFTVI